MNTYNTYKDSQADTRDASMRSATFEPPRRRWPGILAAGVLGAGIAAAAVSSFYDPRTLGEKLDATVSITEQKVQQHVDDAARHSVMAGTQVASALADAGITAAVKTALAADPALSAVKIDVNTQDGVVSLAGPAPDERARERAQVLAAAPEGVKRVDNKLVLPTTTTN